MLVGLCRFLPKEKEVVSATGALHPVGGKIAMAVVSKKWPIRARDVKPVFIIVAGVSVDCFVHYRHVQRGFWLCLQYAHMARVAATSSSVRVTCFSQCDFLAVYTFDDPYLLVIPDFSV